MELGAAKHRAGQAAEAEAIYRRVLASQPNHPDALHLLGVLASGAGRFDVATGLISRAVALMPNSALYHMNLGVALDGLNRTDQAAAEFRTALSLRSNYPQAWCNLGSCLAKKGDFAGAVAACRQAIKLDANLPEAHNNLGNALAPLGAYDQAIGALRRAIALRPDYADAYSNLGKAYLSKRSLEDSAAACRKAIALRPGLHEAHNNLASALAAVGNYAEATEHFRKAAQLSPDFALAHFNLGVMLLTQGDFDHGWDGYEWRLRVAEFTGKFESNRPQWSGAALSGRRILLHAEQGLGDVIQFVRYVPLVAARGGKVILHCHADLHRLVRQIGEIEQLTDSSQSAPEHDLHCPLVSLPRVFKSRPGSTAGIGISPSPRTRGEGGGEGSFGESRGAGDIKGDPHPSPRPEYVERGPEVSFPAAAYLHADAELSEKWKRRLESETRWKIGLVWAGRSTHANDRERSIPLAAFAPLAQIPGVALFSLQKGEAASQNQARILPLIDFTAELADFADTAALLANLDVIITVDTAVTHLAGAMGKAAWVLLPFVPDWRWMLKRADSPWYATLRLFRQEQRGDWKRPIGQIVETIAEGLSSVRGL